MLALFTLGFVGRLGVLTRRVGPTSSYQQTVALERGRLTIWTQTWPTGSQMQMSKPVTIQPMVSFRLRFPRIDGRAFGGFDAHPLRVAAGRRRHVIRGEPAMAGLDRLAIGLRRGGRRHPEHREHQHRERHHASHCTKLSPRWIRHRRLPTGAAVCYSVSHPMPPRTETHPTRSFQP